MWLPEKKQWTLIDFGCAAKTDSFAGTGLSLFYGAPEAIAAYKAEEKGVKFCGVLLVNCQRFMDGSTSLFHLS